MARLDGLSDPIRAVYAECVDECMIALCRHFNVSAAGNTGSFDWQVKKLAELGAVRAEVADIVARETAGVEGLVSEAVRTAMLRSLDDVEPELQAAAREGILTGTEDTEMSPTMRKSLEAYSAQAVDQLNLVNTVMLNSCLMQYRKVVASTAAYEQQLAAAQSILNAQTGTVISGVSSMQQAVRRAVKQFADAGLTGFTDRAGHQWSPEAYAAMDIRTTVLNAAREAVLIRNEEYGNDLVSVPINATARPKCYPWQGKVISTANRPRVVKDLDGRNIQAYALSDTTYGDPDGLWGINCHHQPSPFIDGVSLLRGEVPPQEQNDERYRLQQTQRRMEREVRARKREAAMLDAAGDTEGFREVALRVKNAQRRLKEHCAANGLAYHSDRTQVLGYNRAVSGKAKKATRQPAGYRCHKDGTIVVTHDWKGEGHKSIPGKLAPFAVLETYSEQYRQTDRTYYGADARLAKQIHGGPHGKKVTYENGGAHSHRFRDGKRIQPSDGKHGYNLTEQEVIENADIIDRRKNQEPD